MKIVNKKQINDDSVDIDDFQKNETRKRIKQSQGPNIEDSKEKQSENKGKPIDKTIFQFFQDLTNEDEKNRTEASLQLIKQLKNTSNNDKNQKELTYTLKRLMRGCGAATNVSRAGFYTGLVSVFKSYSPEKLPLELVFEIIEKELYVGKTISNREDADAVVGRILICGALLHADRIEKSKTEQLEHIINILVQSTKFRTYHAALGYAFITEYLEKVTESQFAAIWPYLKPELCKPWNKQTIDSIQCLIVAEHQFPQTIDEKLCRTFFGDVSFLNSESYTYLYTIFWEHTNADILTKPAFEKFANYAANCENLSEFWQSIVDQNIEKSKTKLKELITIKMLTDILNNLDIEKTQVSQLLSENFMKMLICGLKHIKEKKDETVYAFYMEFFESLVNCSTRLTNDDEKVKVIKRLILYPGTLNIEKYTSTRIVHQLINNLGEEGIKEIFSLYKDIFTGHMRKHPNNSEQWLNFERLNAGYMLQYLLQQKVAQKLYKWREEQLLFLLVNGVFHVDVNMEICKQNSVSVFNKDYSEQCKNMFFSCLQSKFSDLLEEHKLLMNLATYCQEQIKCKNIQKFVHSKSFDQSAICAWKQMYEAASKNLTNEQNRNQRPENLNKLQLIFRILLLNMGLHLFKEPEMAIHAIGDLLKCMERSKQQQKNIVKKLDENSEEEPQWIEVVVDIFLHLLSQNANALRNIVDALFPHLCGNMNLNAVHHILSMLDMKDGNNPLSTKAEQQEEDNENEDDDYENEDDDENVDDENEDDENEDDDDENEDNEIETDENESAEDDEDDTEDDEEDNENGITNSDKLRNAVSQALMTTGASYTLKSNDMDTDDMSSVDLNDITEEEGRKIDEALSKAFMAMKKNTSSTNKKSKNYRVQTTTVMHFRIRVLDLIEIYLHHNPTLLILCEIMLVLFGMLEHCATDELKPLQNKVEKVLTNLTAMKSNNILFIEKEFNEENIIDFIRMLIEKKGPTPLYDLINRLRNKCVIFLINNASRVCNDERQKKFLELFEEYLEDFLKSRNPSTNINLLMEIFRLRWIPVLNLAMFVSKKEATLETRTFRRIQILDLLSTFYRNGALHKMNKEKSLHTFGKIEEEVLYFLQNVTTQSTKEFETLLELLIIVHKVHKRYNSNSVLCCKEAYNAIQQLRQRICLESLNVYKRYCKMFKLPMIFKNDSAKRDKRSENDTEKIVEKNCVTINKKGNLIRSSDEKFKGKKRIQIDGHHGLDARKLKKQKKESRLIIGSQGIKNDISFSKTNGHNDLES